MKTAALVGIYSHMDELVEAIHRLQKEPKPKKMVVYSPAPFHAILKATASPTSPVRFFTLAGATIGLFGGFALAIWSSLKWNLITGGKPIVSIPPFVIIAFELTILLGALATVLGLIVTANWQSFRITGTYDPRFSQDKFGIAVQVSEDDRAYFEQAFTSTGAEEIHVR
jgi:hypothetical protein